MSRIVENDKYMKEGMDIRRFFLCLIRRIWIIVAVTLICGLVAAGIYMLDTEVIHGETIYRISSDYYITFNEADYPNGMDYYNAYTWGQFVEDDRILDSAVGSLTNIDKQTIKDYVSSDMPSDYRVLTVIAQGPDENVASMINEAYKTAMPAFAEQVNELSSIELWSCDEMTTVQKGDRLVNAAILGLIIGAIISVFGFAVYYCMDDRIYTARDWKKYFDGIEFIGYDTELYKNDTERIKKQTVKGRDVMVCNGASEYIDEIKKHDGCILSVSMGKIHSTELEYRIDLLKKSGCNIFGAVISDCDEHFLKVYYGLGNNR